MRTSLVLLVFIPMIVEPFAPFIKGTTVHRPSYAMNRLQRMFVAAKPTTPAELPGKDDSGAVMVCAEGSCSPSTASAEERQASLGWRGAVLLLTIVWSTNFAAIKGLFQEVPDLDPSLYATIRFGIAALVLSPTYLGALRNGAMVRDSFTVGCFVFIGYVGQSLGLKMGTTADKSAFISSLVVVWVALCPLITRSYSNFRATRGGAVPAPADPTQKVIWPTVLLAVAGVAILELEGSTPPNVGDLFSLLQPVGFGTSYVLIEGMMRRHTGADAPRQLTGLRVLSIALLSLLWALSTKSINANHLESIMHSPTAQASLLYLSCVTTAAGLWLQTLAFREVTASDASIILSSEPVWAALFALGFLGEGITSTDVLGGGLIISACLANELKLDITRPLQAMATRGAKGTEREEV